MEAELLKALRDADYARKIISLLVRGRSAEAAVLGAMPYDRYLQTSQWKQRAAECKAAAGGRCQVCNRYGELHAHHRTYERRGCEEPGDLTALCDDCHAMFHAKVPPEAPLEIEPAEVVAAHRFDYLNDKTDDEVKVELAAIVSQHRQRMKLGA